MRPATIAMLSTAALVIVGLVVGLLVFRDSGERAAEPPSSEPTSAQQDRAAEIVEDFDDAQLAGALIVATGPDDPALAAQQMAELELAGMIVMGTSLPEDPSAEDVAAYTAAVQGAVEDRAWPALLGVDQEGGPVERLSGAIATMPPMMAHGAADDPDLTREAIAGQAQQLADLGFTMSFAPVADVTIGAADPTIGIRSASDDPELVSRLVAAAVEGQQSVGVAASAKHFPGHGGLTVDTHEEIGALEQDLDGLAERDLPPFAAAAEAGTATIMIGHMALADDPELPASLSPEVYELARSSYGENRVLITDALNMGAIDLAPGQETVTALGVGADLALMPEDPAAAHAAVLAALESGELDRDDLVAKAERVVALQLWSEAEPARTEAVPDEVRTALAESSATVLAGECRRGGAPESVALLGGTDDLRADVTAALEERGVSVSDGAETSLTIGRGEFSSGADIGISFADPWPLADAGSAESLAVWHDGPEAVAAAADWLTGELEAGGTLPVEIEGLDAPSCG